MTSEYQIQLRREWDLAEAAIKSGEVLSSLVVVPSIVELRYAGRRVVDALASEDPKSIERHFISAIEYCRRARLEALEAQAMYLISKGAYFRKWQAQSSDEADLQIRFNFVLRDLGYALSQLREVRTESRDGQEPLADLVAVATDLYLSLNDTKLRDTISSRSARWLRYVLGASAGFATALVVGVGVGPMIDRLIQLLVR